jgi:hypothetical protein
MLFAVSHGMRQRIMIDSEPHRSQPTNEWSTTTPIDCKIGNRKDHFFGENPLLHAGVEISKFIASKKVAY